MTRTLRLLPLLTVAVLFGPTAARADPITFSYSWDIDKSVFKGGTGSSTLALATEPDGTGVAVSPGSPAFVHGAKVTTDSTVTSPPDSFTGSFTMTMHLTDDASHASQDLTFSATVSGGLTKDTSGLSLKFDNPFTKTVTLGNNDYTVTMAPTLGFIMAPTPTGKAEIDAMVAVAPHTGGGTPPPQAPEPTSLVLGATAVLGFAARRLWLRRSRAA
jgi:hypothetical protein